jgi:anti-sigma regulatory factor (Ser/Thr protein kinase)
MKELVVGAGIENLYTVQGFLRSELEAAGCAEDVLFNIDFAVVEIFVNIAKYAYKQISCSTSPTTAEQPDTNEGNVLVRISITDEIVVVFEDEGMPFNPLEEGEPDINSGLEDRKTGGLGIFSARVVMNNNIHYNHDAGRNILTIRKKMRNKPGGVTSI